MSLCVTMHVFLRLLERLGFTEPTCIGKMIRACFYRMVGLSVTLGIRKSLTRIENGFVQQGQACALEA